MSDALARGEGLTVDAAAAAAVVSRTLDEAIALHRRVRALDPAPVVDAAQLIADAYARGAKLLVFGNGGSAADAQHLATELVGRYLRERRGFAALALAVDGSLLTSVANDYGFERIFARQIEALGAAGDIAFAITTSGTSLNVIAGLRAARAQGLRTIALTGRDGGAAGALADVHVNVPDGATPRVQEVHIALIHAICEIVEAMQAGKVHA